MFIDTFTFKNLYGCSDLQKIYKLIRIHPYRLIHPLGLLFAHLSLIYVLTFCTTFAHGHL